MSMVAMSAAEETQNTAEAPQPVAVVDDFHALEERVLRTVELLRAERQARTAVEQKLAEAEGKLKESASQLEETAQYSATQQAEIEVLEAKLAALSGERDDVRKRVERLLGQLDDLSL